MVCHLFLPRTSQLRHPGYQTSALHYITFNSPDFFRPHSDLTPNRGSRKIPLPRPDLATNKHFTLLGASRRHNQTSHELAYYDVWNSLPGIFTPSLHSTGAWRFVPAQADEPLAAFSGQFISCQHTVRIVDRRRVSPGEI